MNYELKGLSVLDTKAIDAGIMNACSGSAIDPSMLLPINLPTAVLWMLVRTEYDHTDKEDRNKLVDYILSALKIEEEKLRDKLRVYYHDLVTSINLSKLTKAFNHIRVHDKRLLVVERWDVLSKDVGKDAVDITTGKKKPKCTSSST